MVVVRTHDGIEAARLIAAGGRLRRLAYDMAVDLKTARTPETRPLSAGLHVERLDADIDGIALAAANAVPPSHVDFGIWSGVDRFEYWRQLLAGEGPCGSVLPAASCLVRDQDGAIVAALVVTDMPASEWWAGDPWIPEVFVVSGHQGQGLGGLLVGHAARVCVDGGYGRLGLTVSDGNPARHLYERFGFQAFRTTWLIQRPPLR
ncbi:MAG: GNAT family N-acetyltransferase [Candidatus Dormiibacterota bacterium]